MVGATTGTGSDYPDNWIAPAAGFQTIDNITEVGTENGMEFIEVRYDGTPSSDGNIIFESNGQILASINEVWTISAFVKLVAGDFTNMTGLRLGIRERDASSTLDTNFGSNFTPTSSIVRSVYTETLDEVGVTNFLPILQLNYDGSGAVDFTIRIYLPQCEERRDATNPIKTIDVSRSNRVTTGVHL